MIKPLQDALGKVDGGLSVDKQAVAAELPGVAGYPLSSDERMVVREALARATQGGFVDETDINVMLRRPWA